jgi:hypothetical protein
MVSHLFFYQLALITLMGLFFLLFYAWPSERARRPPLAASITPPRPRSNAPKPFAGLPQKPSCALCEQDILSPQAPPAVRPDPIPPPHRRSRTVDTSQHFCPHTGCRYRGWLGLGNLRANGHPSGGPWRQFHCTACKGYFPEHHGTLFHGKQIAVELIVRVLACLAEGLGIRATARVFEVNPNTVLQWLGEAVDQLQAFAHYFLCEIHVRQLQVDELYAVLKAMKAGDLSEDEAIRRLSPSPHWVWTAMDPETKLLLVSDVGTHTLAMAQRVLHQVAHCLAPDGVPLFLSDGFKDYLPAILTHFGCWSHPKRHHAKGPAPQPRWRTRPELLYAQVIKTLRRRRLVRVTHRVVFGTREAVEQVLAACGWPIQTAFVERLNLTIRQHVTAIGRRVNTLCQGEDGLRQQVVLFQTYYNFVLPHASLHQVRRQPLRANGKGSATLRRPCMPAMATGLTDHVWSLQEVLLFRVPPWR